MSKPMMMTSIIVISVEHNKTDPRQAKGGCRAFEQTEEQMRGEREPVGIAAPEIILWTKQGRFVLYL